jgi:hypothetical protein
MHSLKRLSHLAFGAAVISAVACGGSSSSPPATPSPSEMPATPAPLPPAPPDTREGLKAGLDNAGEASWNLKVSAKAVSPPGFLGITNSDLAFTGNYAIQGNYNGIQIWDISNPSSPQLVTAYSCPASQNDVSVYRNLLFMSAEAFNGGIDCKPIATVPGDTVNANRIRGVRIFDISDIRNPKLVANVQTCRGSHTHTVVENPNDRDNVYIYVSGSAPIRPKGELARCVADTPDKNNQSSLMKIEIIRVPIARPQDAAVVSEANIFAGLSTPPAHGATPAEKAITARRVDSTRRVGGFTAVQNGEAFVVNPAFTAGLLDSIVRARGATGAATSADSANLRANLQSIIDKLIGPPTQPGSPNSAFRQCHDITVYPAIGLAGGACEGHGFLLDISNPTQPRRLAAAADSNFAYWHSATFNNDGTKLLFSDEWGGGGAPKCRATDPKEWGANAIFTVENRQLKFKSYYKIPTVQTNNENCVAHNGSLIPIPGRDVMVQSWYQGGISVFDWTDASNPREIAYFDRGPVDSTRMQMGGSWSVYWYNGKIVSSEIARGLDVAELVPSPYISQNEIDAAKTVRMPYLNAQSQPKFVWPPSFPLVKSYVDQLERNKCMTASRVSYAREQIASAERLTGSARNDALNKLSNDLGDDARNSCDPNKVRMLQSSLKDLTRAVAQ